HILGGVDFEKRGNGGIEQGMEDELGGRPGFASMVTDVRHRGFESNIEVEPIPGNDVALTIDYRVQYELEKLLAQSVESEKCWSGRGIVMDPHTGEILAMASFPTYNPNGKVTDLEARQNLPVQSAIEPGSVFKIFTIASALEEKTVKPSSSFNCHHGKFNLFGRIIRDSTKNGYGYLTVEDILAKSSNIGSIQVGMTVGDKLFHKYILDFGFGARTGLPLPGESTGRVRRLSKWTKSSIGSVAMVHEIMATTVQLAQGASIIANGGKFVRPKLVHHVTTPSAGGFAIRTTAFIDPPSRPKQIRSPETVRQLRQMLEHGVLAGPGALARVRG
ncbi:MAG: peptidoglycan D,D-transpeptidase FtsI family protein, partial [Acidobacteriota bacterium]